MLRISINASRSYDVRIGGSQLLSGDNGLAEILAGKTAVIVSDDTVFSIYGEEFVSFLENLGIKTIRFVFPHGEQSKNIETYSRLLEAMCSQKVTRNDYVVALGGGVVGDLAGFAAATYQRGIGFIQIPTTLLAAVDSSVGGKTGVDLESGKNQVGAFYQPSLVICDPDTLKTLPEAEYRNGCAEIIKYAMIGSRTLYDEIFSKQVSKQYEKVISKCVSMKQEFVEKDERDLGARMMLNFGHTIGHAIETCSNYAIPHGTAVAEGMAIITKAAVSLGLCEASVYSGLVELLKKYGLPFQTNFSAEQIYEAALTDKKRLGGRMTIVVPLKIGKCELKEIRREEFPEWLKAGGLL